MSRLPATEPTAVNVEAFLVVDPAARRLIDRPGKTQPVALNVSQNSNLLVVQPRRVRWPPVGIDGYSHLHIQVSLRHHPGEHLQTAACFLVRWRQIGGKKMRFETSSPVVSFADGVLLRLLGSAGEHP